MGIFEKICGWVKDFLLEHTRPFVNSHHLTTSTPHTSLNKLDGTVWLQSVI